MVSVFDKSKNYLFYGPMAIAPLCDMFMKYVRKLNYATFITYDDWAHFEMTPFATVQEVSEFLYAKYNIETMKGTYAYYESKTINDVHLLLQVMITPLYKRNCIHFWNKNMTTHHWTDDFVRDNVDRMQIDIYNFACIVTLDRAPMNPPCYRPPVSRENVMLQHGQTIS